MEGSLWTHESVLHFMNNTYTLILILLFHLYFKITTMKLEIINDYGYNFLMHRTKKLQYFSG